MSNLILTDAAGRTESTPYSELTPDEVRVLRDYKRFLVRRGYREALYCQECGKGQDHDGCRAYVTEKGDILISCRCRSVGHKEFGVN